MTQVQTEPKSLTFAQLREANVARLPTFKNAKGVPYHKPDGSDWTLGEWINALGGEIGEAQNIVKKVQRGDFTLDQVVRDLMDEVADVQTYLDIIAFRAGIDIFPGKSFGELRAQTLKRYHAADAKPKGSLGELFNRLQSYAGDMAFMADMIREERVSMDNARDRLRQYILHLQAELDVLCYASGIDLGKATAVKFNMVSCRVRSPVFIDLADIGRPLKCKDCGHVYKFDKRKATPHLRYEDSYWSQGCPSCTHGEARLMMVPGEACEVAKGFK